MPNRHVLVVATALLLTAPARDVAADPRNAPIPTNRFIDDMRRKNIDDVLSLYTPDAVFVDFFGRKFATVDTRRTFFEQTFQTFDTEDLVFEHLLTVIRGPFHSETVEQGGEYTEVLRTRDTDEVQRYCGDYHVLYKHFVDSLQSDQSGKPESKWLITLQEWALKPCPLPSPMHP